MNGNEEATDETIQQFWDKVDRENIAPFEYEIGKDYLAKNGPNAADTFTINSANKFDGKIFYNCTFKKSGIVTQIEENVLKDIIG